MGALLTKEEEMQWRRSTEKITLEEYARRLGKDIGTKKETNDLHDRFLQKINQPEEELIQANYEIKHKNVEPKPSVEAKNTVEKKQEEKVVKVETPVLQKNESSNLDKKITFNKKLNKREEIVFNYFLEHKNEKITVSDIAKLLELPNDYVYKYIKNLRAKIAGDLLVNADKGGYILNV